MKLVTFTQGSETFCGALVESGGAVAKLQAAYNRRWGAPSSALNSVLAILEAGPEGMEQARDALKSAVDDGSDVVPLASVKLLAPIPNPPQMRDFIGFEKHISQADAASLRMLAAQSSDPEAALRDLETKGKPTVPAIWYETPLYYHPNRFNVVGTEEMLQWPAYSDMLDFELEFGCYIGRTGRDIPAAQARDHIAGYTVFNDISARDEQFKVMAGRLGPGKGKAFDTSNVMGPCLVTVDEMPDPYNLEMIVRVDGEEWGRGNTRDMNWSFEDSIANISRSETLHVGEFFGSGTVGDGCGLESLRFLKPGNVVELEVEGIGILRNKVGPKPV